jgi:hypothetical protein
MLLAGILMRRLIESIFRATAEVIQIHRPLGSRAVRGISCALCDAMLRRWTHRVYRELGCAHNAEESCVAHVDGHQELAHQLEVFTNVRS